MSAAWKAGYMACYCGHGLSVNPYLLLTPDSEAWEMGYESCALSLGRA